MNSSQVLNVLQTQVGYHEKVANTPTSALYVFRNNYDGAGNWTKYHADLGVSQGDPWCGYFAYWVFWNILNRSKSATDTFLHGISYYGAAVSSWRLAFTNFGMYHEGDGYIPKPGDAVIFSDTGYPDSHVEIITDVSDWPNYINTIGGNTTNPGEGGDQSQGMWVASRRRYAQGTTGFHVRGYCEMTYEDTPVVVGSLLLKKKRLFTAFG